MRHVLGARSMVSQLSLSLARWTQRHARLPGRPPDTFYAVAPAPLILSHRGARTQRAENTVDAFVLGMQQGAHGAELDVHLTADRQVVVFHDTHLGKLGQPNTAIHQCTLAQLQALNIATLVKDGPPQAGHVTMPTLTQVLDALPAPARVNVELKGGDLWREDGLEVEVLRVVARARAESRVIYSAFHPARLFRLRRLAPDAWVGMLHEAEQAAPLAHLYLLPAVAPHAVHPHFSMVDDAYMKHARDLGMAVHVWTVNDPVEMVRLRALGVDAVITDVPDLAVATLQPHAPSSAGTPA